MYLLGDAYDTVIPALMIGCGSSSGMNLMFFWSAMLSVDDEELYKVLMKHDNEKDNKFVLSVFHNLIISFTWWRYIKKKNKQTKKHLRF